MLEKNFQTQSISDRSEFIKNKEQTMKALIMPHGRPGGLLTFIGRVDSFLELSQFL